MGNIAIIGGSGFIGTYTKNELVEHGYNVTTIDVNKKSDICVNVLNYKHLKKALSTKKFDVVYMFAAISDSKENHTDIKHAVNTNIMSLTNTLDAMHELGIPRIIF